MDIKKCDLCKKVIEERGESVYVRASLYESADLCTKCATPISKFLEKNKLIKKENKKS